MPDGGALPGWPRALREPLAAAYVGLSGSTFRQVVMPAVAPIRLTTGRVAWLREDLDAWLDARRPSRPQAIDASLGDGDAAPSETHHAADAIAAGLANLSAPRGARGPRPAR